MEKSKYAWKVSFIYKDQVYDVFEYMTRSPEITNRDMEVWIIYSLEVKQNSTVMLTAFYHGWSTITGKNHTICSIVTHKDIFDNVKEFCKAGKIDLPDGCNIKTETFP